MRNACSFTSIPYITSFNFIPSSNTAFSTSTSLLETLSTNISLSKDALPKLPEFALYAERIALLASFFVNSELVKNSLCIIELAVISLIPNRQQADANLKIKLFLSPVTNASFLFESQVTIFLNVFSSSSFFS